MILYNVWNFIDIAITNGAHEDATMPILEVDGYKTKILIGKNGRNVPIDVTDGDLLESEVMGHLKALGLDDLIPAMCPNVSTKPIFKQA